MDDSDRQLLILFQKEIPLKPRPFEALAKTAGIDSADLMLRFNRLQEAQKIGRISAIFDTEKLGYRSYLIAAQVVLAQRDQAAYYISGHPGVTQCIWRKGSFNLWFSLLLPASESLEFHAGCLKELTGAQQLLVLNAVQWYKPAAKIQAEEPRKKNAAVSGGKIPEDLTEMERKLISMIQEEVPLFDEPYRKIARELGITEELVLKQLQFFQKTGLLKKIAARPAAQEKQVSNALVLWDVPEEKVVETGRKIAAFEKVSFCVQRSAFRELPYNLHVVIENVAEEKLPEAVEVIEKQIGMWPRQCLMKEKEEKRGRLKYFSKDIEDWRMTHEDFAIRHY